MTLLSPCNWQLETFLPFSRDFQQTCQLWRVSFYGHAVRDVPPSPTPSLVFPKTNPLFFFFFPLRLLAFPLIWTFTHSHSHSVTEYVPVLWVHVARASLQYPRKGAEFVACVRSIPPNLRFFLSGFVPAQTFQSRHRKRPKE